MNHGKFSISHQSKQALFGFHLIEYLDLARASCDVCFCCVGGRIVFLRGRGADLKHAGLWECRAWSDINSGGA